MSLRDRFTEDLKQAMKSRDRLRTDVIRLIKAAILNREIELKKDLDDTEMSRVMTVLIKQRREAIEQYQKANRLDLADKELQEIAIIESYLPRALTAQEIAAVVEAVIQETGAMGLRDMGPVMKLVMTRLAGQAVDGREISELVRSKLQTR